MTNSVRAVVLLCFLPYLSFALSGPERATFIKTIQRDIDQGIASLFPEGYECLESKKDFLGASSHGKRKQIIRDIHGHKHVFFIKIFFEKTPFVERRRIVETTKALAAVWGYPTILWHDPLYHIMMTEFVEGSHPDEHYFKDPETLKSFIVKLKQSHILLATLPLHFPKDSLYVRSKKRLQELLKVAPELKERLGKAEKFLKDWKPSFTRVIHGDIHASNILLGKEVCLIDWSEVSLGDIFEDFGSLAEHMHFTPEQEHQMLFAYFGKVSPKDLKKLEQHRLLTRIHFGCYYLRQGFKELAHQKAKRAPGTCGLYLEPQIQQGMELLKPFLA
jgi:thiamine kinase-like enzyme